MTDIDKAVDETISALPFESWERLPGETNHAFAAFLAFRDLGLERTIRKAVEAYVSKQENATEKDKDKRYRVWRNWCSTYRWRERTADYDRYMEKLKQTEVRKTIEAQGEKQRAVTGKMLSVVEKKLDTMNPADLTQGAVTEWVATAIRAEREARQFADANCLGVSASRNSTQVLFAPDFNEL